MSQAQTAADVENPAFFDPFQCYRVAARRARLRNQLAVKARIAGNAADVARHIDQRDWLMDRARQWHDMIDWSNDNGEA